jgi:hypothetical protein
MFRCVCVEGSGVCLGLDGMPGPHSGISVYKSFFNYFHVLNIHVLIELFIYFVVFIVFHI